MWSRSWDICLMGQHPRFESWLCPFLSLFWSCAKLALPKTPCQVLVKCLSDALFLNLSFFKLKEISLGHSLLKELLKRNKAVWKQLECNNVILFFDLHYKKKFFLIECLSFLSDSCAFYFVKIINVIIKTDTS